MIIMNSMATADICRITVVGPGRRVDLALPAHVPFAELFPVIARYAGLDRAAVAQAPGGWVLQRLGQSPFPPPVTPAQAGLLDGELIYLRPREAEMPPARCDDIADAIAGVHEGADRWRPADARPVALGAGAALLLAGVAAILRAGPPWTIPALASAVMALLLLTAGVASSRAAGAAAGRAASSSAATNSGLVLGYAALPYAFLAGLAAPAGRLPLPHVGVFGLLAGFAAMTLAAILAAAGIAEARPAFCGAAVAAAAGFAAAWLMYAVRGLSPAGAAAMVVTPALALTPLIPAIAFRLARLPLPPVPASAEDLRDEALMVPGEQTAQQTVERARVADAYVTGGASALGLIGAGAEFVLGRTGGGGWLTLLAGAVLAGVLILRARIFGGRAQRLWLMIPGYGGLAWLVSGRLMPGPLLPVLGLLAAAAAIVIGVGSWLPAHRPSPFWGRAADIADTLLIVGMIPAALAVAGVFGYLHGLGG
jgi:type VII secretion integral membrane protein EccD